MRINKPQLFRITIVLATFMNLLYLHYSVADKFIGGRSPLYALLDVCILFFVPLLLVRFYRSILYILHILSTIFIAVNLGYSRYFDNYMPYSLYTKTENLAGLGPNVVNAYRWSDLFLLLILFLVSYFYFSQRKEKLKGRLWPLPVILSIVTLVACGWITRNATHKDTPPELSATEGFVYHLTQSRAINPKDGILTYGFVLNGITDVYEEYQYSRTSKELTPEEKKFLLSKTVTIGDSILLPKNIFFIMGESFSSAAISREQTPTLDSLCAVGIVARNTISLEKLGQSSDGQYTYLTGLYPYRKNVTINAIKAESVPSFVSLIKAEYPDFKSQMILPTERNYWQQDVMCERYGIDESFGNTDFGKTEWLNDEEVFQLAESRLSEDTKNTIQIILTCSTHSPYNDGENEEESYLKKMQYADKCISGFVQTLRRYNLLESSLLIIASDHKPPTYDLPLEQYQEIPIIIAGCNLQHKEIERQTTQADLFPTILDLMRIHNPWRGVGQSLLLPDSAFENYNQTAIMTKAQEISDKLILQSPILIP